MRPLLAIALALCATLAFAEQPSPRTRIHALVAAVGDQFQVIYEEKSTGSSLPPFRRRTVEVGANQLNRIVLRSLDQAMEKADPGSERLYLALTPPPNADAIAWIVGELEKIPQHAQWDSIVVATPGYQGLAVNRMPSRMRGLGLFAQPMCQSNPEACDRREVPFVGADAVTPDGKPIQANYFVAPFSLLDIRLLDPKTLAVIEKLESYDHQKFYDPKAVSSNMFDNVDKAALAQHIVSLVERSVTSAMAGSELRGKVDVRLLKEVKPDADRR